MPMIPRGRCSGLIKRQDFPETSGFVLFGWFSMALLDTLVLADKDYLDYDHLQQMYRDLIDSMLKFQSPEGMWYQVPNFLGRERRITWRQAAALSWHIV